MVKMWRRSIHRSALLAALLPICLVSASCGPREESASSEETAQADDSGLRWEVPADARMVGRESEALADLEDGQLRALKRRLLEAEPSWSFGSLDDPEAQWGIPTHIVTDRLGNVYVLDQLLMLVRSLSSEGGLGADLLTEGEGPLEVQNPIGLEIGPADSMMVHSSSRIRFFSVDLESAEPGRRLLLDWGFTDMCWVGNKAFLRIGSASIDGTVLVVSPDGQKLRSFGEAFTHPDAGVSAQLSMGGMACDAGTDRVVVFMNDGPLLIGYQLSGERAWQSAFSEFAPPDVAPMVGGVRRLGGRPNDRILGVTIVSDGYALVQVADIGASERVRGRRIRPIRRLDSYVFGLQTGEGLFVGSDLPQILHANDSALFSVEEHKPGYLTVGGYRW